MIDNPFQRKQHWRHRGKGPGGRNLCHCGCGREVSPPRRTCFSNECLTAWKLINDPATIAAFILKRDRGICAHCGLDTEALRQRAVGSWFRGDDRFDEAFWVADQMGYRNQYVEVGRAWTYKIRPDVEEALSVRHYLQNREIEIPWRAFQEEQRRELAALGFTDTSRRFWEADHIVPVSEGGGGCGPEGYRTLCLPCHRKETAKLAARLAAKRRAERQPELLGFSLKG